MPARNFAGLVAKNDAASQSRNPDPWRVLSIAGRPLPREPRMLFSRTIASIARVEQPKNERATSSPPPDCGVTAFAPHRQPNLRRPQATRRSRQHLNSSRRKGGEIRRQLFRVHDHAGNRKFLPFGQSKRLEEKLFTLSIRASFCNAREALERPVYYSIQ